MIHFSTKNTVSSLSNSRQVVFWLGVVAVGLMAGMGLQIAQAAWTPPGSTPPNGNTLGPITVQDEDVDQLIRHGFIRQSAARPLLSLTLSLPLGGLKTQRGRLRSLKLPHCFIAEQGYSRKRLKSHVPRLRSQPVDHPVVALLFD